MPGFLDDPDSPEQRMHQTAPGKECSSTVTHTPTLPKSPLLTDVDPKRDGGGILVQLPTTLEASKARGRGNSDLEHRSQPCSEHPDRSRAEQSR